MGATRRKFSREFKLEAVRQLEAGRRLAEVARELGVHATVLRRWKDQVAVDAETAFPGNGRMREPEEGVTASATGECPAALGAGFFKKSGGVLRKGVPVKCRAVLAYRGDLALRRRCKLLGISRSAFYAWCRRPPSRRGRMNGRLVTEMDPDASRGRSLLW